MFTFTNILYRDPHAAQPPHIERLQNHIRILISLQFASLARYSMK
jgi:hypothetical protein